MKEFLKTWGYCFAGLVLIILLTATSAGTIGFVCLTLYYLDNLMFFKMFLSIVGVLILGSFSFAGITMLIDGEYKGE